MNHPVVRGGTPWALLEKTRECMWPCGGSITTSNVRIVIVEILAARRDCHESGGNDDMRKAGRLPEQGIKNAAPAPDLIPAGTNNRPRTHITIGTANGISSLVSETV